MGGKKVDSRVRTLVEHGARTRTRSFFFIVGSRGREQVVNLHYMLQKISGKKPSVLWCYKQELGFSANPKKRVKKGLQQDLESPFDLFVSAAGIRYCCYKDSEQVLGKTFGMCVLQDFQALTPNILCRAVETVEGGGVVVILVKAVDSLRRLYDLAMDSHSNFRTEVHDRLEPRFNERFVLSLGTCPACLVVDEDLAILPISAHAKPLGRAGAKEDGEEVSMSAREQELENLKKTIAETQHVGPLVGVARTVDQAKAVMTFVDAVSEKSLNRTLALTAARGRGKSATLGLSIAAAVAHGYSNIFVTAPSPENLGTVFEFVVKGFDALGMKEREHYELVQAEDPELNRALVRVNVFRDHRQTIQYIAPSDWQHLAQAELLVVDEAAAIPLPVVKKLLGPYIVLLSSTVNGYEGTGRALSLKLIEDLRRGKAIGRSQASGTRSLQEATLEEPIRYAQGDHIEAWLGRLLCLEAAQVPKMSLPTLPMPSQCGLFLLNRDALFSHHEASERFLFKMMSLFVSSHYKNSPNDLFLMADAPAHHMLVLLPPVDIRAENEDLPEILVAIQLCLEGGLSEDSVKASLRRGKSPAGDLIPWTLAQQFLHEGFPQLEGARIVRVATHPALQRQGYASEALRQLLAWLESRTRGSGSFGEHTPRDSRAAAPEAAGLLEEKIEPRDVPPLLEAVTEIPPPSQLDYIGTAFGLTHELYEFWRKCGFRATYLRQTAHSATGEHSCILVRALKQLDGASVAEPAIERFVADFRRRFLRLLQGPFRDQPTRVALSVVDPNTDARSGAEAAAGDGEMRAADAEEGDCDESKQLLTPASLLQFISRDDVHRIEQYGKNMVEYGLILDIVPIVSELYLARRLPEVRLSPLQCAMLVGMGCQQRSLDQLAKELGVPSSQLLALFNKAMLKIAKRFRALLELQAEEEMDDEVKKPLASGELLAGGKFVKDSLLADQQKAAKVVDEKLDQARKQLLESLGDEYAVAPSEAEMRHVLGDHAPKGSISVPRKRRADEDTFKKKTRWW